MSAFQPSRVIGEMDEQDEFDRQQSKDIAAMVARDAKLKKANPGALSTPAAKPVDLEDEFWGHNIQPGRRNPRP